MEYIGKDIMPETISGIQEGTYTFIDISQYEMLGEEDVVNLGDIHRLWFIDGKIERYAVLNVILERCIDRALTKAKTRHPYGLVNGQDVVAQGQLKSAQDLYNAMSSTLFQSIKEEMDSLGEEAEKNPTSSLAKAYTQFNRYTLLFNQHLSGWTGRISRDEFLIHGTTTGIKMMTTMVNTIPTAFNDPTFQKKHPNIIITEILLTNTLENSLERNIPIISSDMYSFRFLRDNTIDSKNWLFKPDKVHLVKSGEEWSLAFVQDVLQQRKSILMAQRANQQQSVNEYSRIISCPVNHVPLLGDEDIIVVSTMRKMEELFTTVGGLMYQDGFRGPIT